MRTIHVDLTYGGIPIKGSIIVAGENPGEVKTPPPETQQPRMNEQMQELITDKQMWKMFNLGIKYTDKMTKHEAWKLIQEKEYRPKESPVIEPQTEPLPWEIEPAKRTRGRPKKV
jgi:hypothetical protein